MCRAIFLYLAVAVAQAGATFFWKTKLGELSSALLYDGVSAEQLSQLCTYYHKSVFVPTVQCTWHLD